MADRPHFAHPFRRSSGKVAVVEQDTTEHVMACENVILACPAGFRVERPGFGWPFPDYRTVVDGGELLDAVRRLEPRSSASVEDLTNRLDPSTRELKVEVSN